VLQASVLVTLGGCHLLDSLVTYGPVEARTKIVRSSGKGIVRGDCAHTAGIAKRDSSRVCHLVTTLASGVLVCPKRPTA
jgi:hypothetical protein